MGQNELAVMDELDSIVQAFNTNDEAALMQASGQSSQPKQTGLPRLNINYDTETDDGTSLTRGHWRITIDGQALYAPSVTLRPILRMYEYSRWDAENNTFASKSVQKISLGGTFLDTEGGSKCGRLSRDEEERASEEEQMISRAAVCNQVIYGQISGTFKTAEGNDVQIERRPMVAYFKKSGFMPISNFIEGLSRQTKVMQRCEMVLNTSKQKKGSVTYWVPSPTLGDSADITDEDKALMKMFAETVSAHNNYVADKSKEAMKMVMGDSDIDLADDFADANVA